MVATFIETCAATFRKYVAEQGLPKPIWLKTSQTFMLHSSAFALEEQLEKVNFQFFYVKQTLRWLVSIKRVHKLLKNM